MPESNEPFLIMVDEAGQVLGERGSGKTSPEEIDWRELVRLGRKSMTVVEELRNGCLSKGRFTQVADISQFGVDPRPIGDTPESPENSISDYGTIAPSPVLPGKES